MATRVGLYPGTFDPIHNGHMDIIGRAVKLVDRLVVGVAVETGKNSLFTLDERVAILQADIETVFLMADPRHQAIASSLVKVIAKLDGDVSKFVSPRVRDALLAKAGQLG